MEIILFVVGFVLMISSTALYLYLVETKKIKPMPLGRHGGFEVRYSEEDYKKFDKEEVNDTVQRQSDSKKATTWRGS